MPITTFLIHGWGWRSRQFAAIAAALPDSFRCVGVLRRQADGSEGDLPVFTDAERARQTGADVALVALPWKQMPDATAWWCEQGLTVLAETPPAPDAEGLLHLWSKLGDVSGARANSPAKVQVAEQYPAMPFHRAVDAVIASGLIGAPNQAEVSIGHGYHGMALIRRFLHSEFACPRIRGIKHIAKAMAGPGRNGPPTEERVIDGTRTIATLDFGDGRLGVHDFDGAQYFSWIRSSHLRVRGVRGEIDDSTLRWLIDHRTPMQATLERREGGQRTNLEGKALQGYIANGQWWYRSPYTVALSDDALAMATTLEQAGALARNGYSNGYSLADASHDHWLGLHADQAIAEGREITVPTPPWAGHSP
jgi:predicted dehydrogenase